MGKKKTVAAKKAAPQAPDAGRRRMLWLGLGGVGALATAGVWARYGRGSGPSEEAAEKAAGSTLRILAPATLPADPETALRACEEMITHYARELKNASSVIHAVRAFGRDFKMGDGTRGVDFLCSRYAAEKEVNGKRYVFFPRDAEVHDNSFLKTFLEAGVSPDQQITAGSSRYTLRDLGESAKALFRFDPANLYRYDQELVHNHLPWGLIAFSILIPASDPVWTNAWGEKNDFTVLIDRSLREYERTSALAQEALLGGRAEPQEFRTEIKKYSCFGMHTAYSYLSCLKHGYRGNDLERRLVQMMDLVSYRLKGDAEAIVAEYAAEGRGAPPIVVEALQQRALAKLYGHAFESINFVKAHRLFAFSAGQERRFAAAERALAESIIKLRALDWGMLARTVDAMLRPGQGEKFINDIVISLGHAARAMKLLTPSTPDATAAG